MRLDHVCQGTRIRSAVEVYALYHADPKEDGVYLRVEAPGGAHNTVEVAGCPWCGTNPFERTLRHLALDTRDPLEELEQGWRFVDWSRAAVNRDPNEED